MSQSQFSEARMGDDPSHMGVSKIGDPNIVP